MLCVSSTASGDDDVKRYVVESRKASLQILQQIRGELIRELEASGPLRAVIVCKYVAPEITSGVSRKTGWRVSRVSLRPRNPALGAPDPWEQRVLADFEQRQARGEKAETLEQHEVVTEPAGRYFRYMRAITMTQTCVACHGPGEGLTEATKGQILAEYPHDKAFGYTMGQVRGAVTVKRLLGPP